MPESQPTAPPDLNWTPADFRAWATARYGEGAGWQSALARETGLSQALINALASGRRRLLARHVKLFRLLPPQPEESARPYRLSESE